MCILCQSKLTESSKDRPVVPADGGDLQGKEKVVRQERKRVSSPTIVIVVVWLLYKFCLLIFPYC